MTRKRFVKLLMAKGYSRNSADCIAWEARRKGYSYEKAYHLETAIPDLVDRIAPAIIKLGETVGRMAAALGAGFAAFGEAFHAAMEADRKQVEAEVYGVDTAQAQNPALMEALREFAQ